MPNVIIAGMEYGGISTDPENAVEILHELARARKMNEVQGVPLLGTGNMPKQRLVAGSCASLAAELRSTRQTSIVGLQADSRSECQGNRRTIPLGGRENIHRIRCSKGSKMIQLAEDQSHIRGFCGALRLVDRPSCDGRITIGPEA